jgi:hypothetical protein
MAVSLELHNTGNPSIGAEIQALVEHHLGDRPGDWRVSIVGSRENDSWEMRILGPNGFERSLHIGRKCGRAPAIGDRKRAAEIATGEDAVGVNHRRNPKQKCQAQLNEHLVISFKTSNQK